MKLGNQDCTEKDYVVDPYLVPKKEFQLEFFYGEQVLDLLTMTKDFDDQTNDEEVLQLDDFCEECKKEGPSVSQNLILTGFKTCNSCKLSKTIFPI